MSGGGLSNIEALEQQLLREPGSEYVLRLLLSEYSSEETWDPRLVDRIVEYVTLFPRGSFARTPFVSFHRDESPEGWRRVEQAWLAHASSQPADPVIARGFAFFLAETDAQRALDVLREAERASPEDPDLLTDMGLVSREPTERLKFFQRARDLGGSQPNLLVWIARAAIDAGDLDAADRAGEELLTLAAEARSTHGDRLDWHGRGRDLWREVSAQCSDRRLARQLVDAISDHANRKHWGHTIRGVVAVRRGDIPAGLAHLKASAEVAGEPRLASYGPSFRLVQEVLRFGEWDAATMFLRSCRKFWDAPALDEWLADLASQKIPEFPHQ